MALGAGCGAATLLLLVLIYAEASVLLIFLTLLLLGPPISAFIAYKAARSLGLSIPATVGADLIVVAVLVALLAVSI
jgi:hypothetical protein